jgi:hypothetical protein
MTIADHWMTSITLRRRDLGLGALGIGAVTMLAEHSTNKF